MRYSIICMSFLYGILICTCIAAGDPSRGWLTVEYIMRDAAWMGTSPSDVHWSEDGSKIYFRWRTGDDEGDSVYVVPVRGGIPQRVPIEDISLLPPPRGDYTRDKTKKTYERHGDIFVFDIRQGTERRITNTLDRKSNPGFTHDEAKITFMSGSNLFMYNLETGLLSQLTNFRSGSPQREKSLTEKEEYLREREFELFGVLRNRQQRGETEEALMERLRPSRPSVFYTGSKSVSQPVLSPDERYISFTLIEQDSRAIPTDIPNYITESGYTETIRSRTKTGYPQMTMTMHVYDTVSDTVRDLNIDLLNTSEKKWKPTDLLYGPFLWSPDGNHPITQLFSQDNKNRWIVSIDLGQATITNVLEYQYDEAWLAGPGIRGRWFQSSIGWMPDSRRIYFQSEETEYSHLYVVGYDGSNKRRLTEGEFEVYSATISADKKKWYLTTNEKHFGERHLYTMPLEGGPRTQITSLEGRNDTYISPREDRIAVIRSYKNEMPELYVMDNKPGAKPQRITHSASADFESYDWRSPELITFRARDGARVPARLYKPAETNGAAVIFVHGAGYLQNAHRWWSTYFREYMFHNLLADKGYTVLDIDYRGSAGLGRNWRTAIYTHMGGKDLDDHIDGARYLVEEHGIDPDRIGIYGGSYGGFIVFMAMFTQPGVFAAGAALRPVTDWAHYAHWYSSNILDIPFEDHENYQRSSPIYHVEGFEGRLLISAPMIDTNVHFQDVVRLVQRLIELGKDGWEVALYPVEDHSFIEPSSWTDQYKRILKLFDETLIP
jgi:dipeptidyl aminopeptidase/acylaminoacyl peptidase